MEVILEEPGKVAEGEQTNVAELEKEEISQPESAPTVIMTVGDGSAQPGHTLVEMGVTLVSSSTAGQHIPSERVKVKIEYPKNWKKDRHMKDGDIKDVSPEVAAQFVALGIASIVEQPAE